MMESLFFVDINIKNIFNIMSNLNSYLSNRQKYEKENHLRESFGIREYRNKSLDDRIRQIAIKINKYNSLLCSEILSNNAQFNIYDKNYNCYLFSENISDCCSWLKQLNIGIIIRKDYDNYNLFDVYTLSDTYAYQSIQNKLTGERKMKLINSNINISMNNQNIIYSKKNDIATIIFEFKYPYSMNVLAIEATIHHELSHISDIQYKPMYNLNSDLIRNDLIVIEDTEELQVLNDILKTKENKEYIINKCEDKATLLCDYIGQNMYNFNESELKAHLNNFKYELLNHSNIVFLNKAIHSPNNKLLINNYDIHLTKVSETYATFRNIYENLNLFKKLMVVEDFEIFKQYVIDFYNEQESEYKKILGDYVYGKDLSNFDGDYIIELLKNRLMKIFFKNAINIAVDILSPDDNLNQKMSKFMN